MRHEEAKKILQVKEIYKTYTGGRRALKQVSFDILKENVWGLLVKVEVERAH